MMKGVYTGRLRFTGTAFLLLSVFVGVLVVPVLHAAAVGGSGMASFRVLSEHPAGLHGCPHAYVFEVSSAATSFKETHDEYLRVKGFADVWYSEYRKMFLLFDPNETLTLVKHEDVDIENGYAIREGAEVIQQDAMAQCVLSPTYCSTMYVSSKSRCGVGAFDNKDAKTYKRGDSDKYNLVREKRPLAWGETLGFACYDTQLRTTVDSSLDDGSVYYYRCNNNNLYNGLLYGYTTYFLKGKLAVYITGKDSPYGYNEGRFYRIFQMDSPADSNAVMVYPWGQYYGKGKEMVTKLVLHNQVDTQALTAVVNNATPVTFELSMRSCEKPVETSERLNVLQVSSGVHYNSFDSSEVIMAGVVESDTQPATLEFPQGFKRLPLLFVQIMDVSGTDFQIHKITKFGAGGATVGAFSANDGTGIKFGYIAISFSESTKGLFGPNVQAMTGQVTNAYGKYDYTAQGYIGEPLVFVDFHSEYDDYDLLPRINSGVPGSLELKTQYQCNAPKRYESNPDRPAPLGMYMTIGPTYQENKTVREALDQELASYGNSLRGCPVLMGYTAPCTGVFFSLDNREGEQWASVDDWRVRLKLNDDNMFWCYHAKDTAVLAVDVDAQCALSDNYCPSLTIMTAGPCAGTYTRYGIGEWRRSASTHRIQLDYKLEPTNHMALSCARERTSEDPTGEGLVDVSQGALLDYVCENDVVPQGLTYGENTILGHRVYILGTREVSQGYYYRLFQIAVPADGTETFVYPMVNHWGVDSMAIKATVHSTTSMVVPRITEMGDASFKIRLIRDECDKSEVDVHYVNILQIRLGHHVDSWTGTDSIVANKVKLLSNASIVYSDTAAVPIIFPGIPVVLGQVYDVVPAANHYFISSQISNIGPKAFDASVQGYAGDFHLDWYFNFAWIAMYMVGDTSKLFGDLSAVKFQTKATEADGTARLDLTAGQYSVNPLGIFDTTSAVAGVVTAAVVGGVYNRTMPVKVATDGCKGGAINLINTTLNGITVGPRTSRSRDASRSVQNSLGCPVIRGFAGCDGKFVTPKQLTTTYALSEDSKLALSFVDDRWFCCDAENLNAKGYCTAAHAQGPQIGTCLLTDTHCEVVEVHGDAEYNGIYKSTRTFDFVQATRLGTSTEDTMLRLYGSIDSGFNPIVLTRAAAGGTGGTTAYTKKKTLKNSQVTCLRSADTNIEGKLDVTPELPVYYVGTKLEEGEGNVFQSNAQLDFNTSGVSWYKYFQMDINENDVVTDGGLYTFVGGGTWNGTVHAYGSMYHDSKSEGIALTFAKVTATALYVDPTVSSCSSFKGVEKVNIFMMRSGRYYSAKSDAKFESVDVAATGSDEASVVLEYIQKTNTLLLAAVHDTQSSQYLVPQITKIAQTPDFSTAVTVKVLPDRKSTWVGESRVAVLRISIYGGKSALYYYSHLNNNRAGFFDMKTTTDLTVDLSYYEFYNIPFVLLGSTTYKNTIACIPRISSASNVSLTVTLSTDGCEVAEVNEDIPVFVFGAPILETLTKTFLALE